MTEPGPPVLPPKCARCMQDAGRRRIERSLRGRTASVPYCTRCSALMGRLALRRLAVALSALLVGVCTALALPIAAPGIGVTATSAISLGASLLPVLLHALLPVLNRTSEPPWLRGAWWHGDALVCPHEGFAAIVHDRNPSTLQKAQRREPRFAVWMGAPLVVVALVGPWSARLHHPTVRILNLTGDRMLIEVDGAPAVSVDPTSAESTEAGIVVRVPAGRRRFEALDATGEHLVTARVTLKSGAQHLFAPASEEYCFWFESVGYGRQAFEPTIRPLSGPTRFWTIPARVKLWFRPAPTQATADHRSTGGVVTALRQAHCAEAPPAARAK